MNKYSCWSLSYSKRYYLTHPWKWFKDVWRCFRDTWRRSIYGWTYFDCWDFDNWFMNVAPDMLRHMADHGSAYPGFEPFDTPEKWHDWLHRMADLIESGREDWQDDHNEYYQDYINEISNCSFEFEKDENGFYHMKTSPRTELDDKYYERAKELATQGKENIKIALGEMAQYWYALWD